jgi:hypothetical protein
MVGDVVMTGLPEALAPWEPELRLFARDLAIALRDLVPRIAAAIGRPRGVSRGADGEPNGYDGIARRGPMGRLLATEWLLASEIPDEFLRRFTSHEQSYLALARAERRGARTITALFDAGPSQLGAPRIAHLALLVVLAQRARASRAELRWSVLQSEELPRTGLDEAGVRALLMLRTAREPSAEDIARGRAHLRAGEEQWLVGGPRLEAHRAGATSVTIEELDDPEAARLRLRRTGRSEITLDLPPPKTCARLLRDPFAAPTDAIARGPGSFVGARILFSSDGHRLLVRLASGPLLAYPIPNSQRAPLGKPTRFVPAAGHVAIATDWRKGRWQIVTQQEAMLRLCVVGKGGGPVTAPRSCFSALRLFDAVGHAPPFTRLHPRGDGAFVFAHRVGMLEIVNTSFRSAKEIAVERYGLGQISVVHGDAGDRFVEYTGGRDTWRHPHSMRGDGDGAILTGFDPRNGVARGGVIAVRTSPGVWTVLTKSEVSIVREPRSLLCVGLAEGGALVGLRDGDRQRLVLVAGDYEKQIVRAGAAITDACVNSGAPQIAYVTASGEVVVHEIAGGQALLRLFGEIE